VSTHAALLHPGSAAPESGIYRVIHDRHRAAHLVVAIRGEEFPNCRKCRATVRYELVQASEYVVDDWDLSGPALRLLA